MHLRTAKPIAFLLLLAASLTWLIHARAAEISTFQSPSSFESALPTPGVDTTATPFTAQTSTPTGTATSSPTATLEPTPSATPEPTMSPTPLGYLPPPTLTSPGTPMPALAPTPWPGDLPLRIAPTETPPAPQTSGQVNFSATLARLIDQGVLAVGYLWLCCGILALVGVGAALIWFLRRSRSR